MTSLPQHGWLLSCPPLLQALSKCMHREASLCCSVAHRRLCCVCASLRRGLVALFFVALGADLFGSVGPFLTERPSPIRVPLRTTRATIVPSRTKAVNEINQMPSVLPGKLCSCSLRFVRSILPPPLPTRTRHAPAFCVRFNRDLLPHHRPISGCDPFRRLRPSSCSLGRPVQTHALDHGAQKLPMAFLTPQHHAFRLVQTVPVFRTPRISGSCGPALQLHLSPRSIWYSGT